MTDCQKYLSYERVVHYIMEAFNTLNRIREQELENFNVKEDAKRRRHTKKWERNRKERIDGISACQWCEEEADTLHVHHVWTPNIGTKWREATDEAFLSSDSYHPELTDDRTECPNCQQKSFYERKTKSPPFYCTNCKTEFEEPATVDGGEVICRTNIPSKPYTTKTYYKEKAKWVKNNTNEVVSVFEEKYEDVLDEYVSLREAQTVVICESCHYKEEQTLLRRCSSCDTNWHKSGKQCWDCIVKEESLEKCACGNWYNPSYYDECSECRTDK